MNSKIILTSLLLVGLSAQAARENRVEPLKSKNISVPTEKPQLKEAESSGAKLGMSTTGVELIKMLDESLMEGAQKAKNMSTGSSNGNIATTFLDNINKNVSDNNMRAFGKRLVEYTATYGKAVDIKYMTVMAKLMDLAGRPGIANSKDYQDLLKNIVKSLASSFDLKSAIDENLKEDKQQSIIDCV